MVESTPLPSAGDAAAQLASLLDQCDAARLRLRALRRDAANLRQRLGEHPTVLMRQANESLVLAALQSQQLAEQRERELGDAERALAFDPLTRLPNRRLLHDRFVQAIGAARRRGGRLGVLFVDLDGFKRINDQFGHAAGDAALRAAAEAIGSVVRETDTVSRHGGDEFVVLLSEISEAVDADAIATKVRWALSQSVQAPGWPSGLSASIGIALFPDHGDDVDELIAVADAAMYRAKRDGPGAPVKLQHPRAAVPAAGLATAHEHHQRLRDVNERLVFAALQARDGQSAAEGALSQHALNLAVTAHELRNPLAPLTYATAMLAAVGGGDPVLPRVHGILERQIGHLSRLIDDLLDVSRAATGRLQLDRHRLRVASLVDSAAQDSMRDVGLRHQHLQVDTGPAGLWVDADPLRIAQVLRNLLDNASKYTPDDGAIQLAVTCTERDVVITVVDSGIGMSPAVLPSIFGAYVRDADAIAAHPAGLGIGLMVARELVLAHGGRLEGSSPGRGLGSRFVVTLPRAEEPLAAGPDSAEPTPLRT